MGAVLFIDILGHLREEERKKLGEHVPLEPPIKQSINYSSRGDASEHVVSAFPPPFHVALVNTFCINWFVADDKPSHILLGTDTPPKALQDNFFRGSLQKNLRQKPWMGTWEPWALSLGKRFLT